MMKILNKVFEQYILGRHYMKGTQNAQTIIEHLRIFQSYCRKLFQVSCIDYI